MTAVWVPEKMVSQTGMAKLKIPGNLEYQITKNTLADQRLISKNHLLEQSTFHQYEHNTRTNKR